MFDISKEFHLNTLFCIYTVFPNMS